MESLFLRLKHAQFLPDTSLSQAVLLGSAFGGAPIVGSSLLSCPLPPDCDTLKLLPSPSRPPFNPMCFFWASIPLDPVLECTLLFCTAYPLVPSFAHSEFLHSRGLYARTFCLVQMWSNKAVSEPLLLESARPCYSQISFVLLLFETPLTCHYFNPTSQLMSEWSWIIYSLALVFSFIQNRFIIANDVLSMYCGPSVVLGNLLSD